MDYMALIPGKETEYMFESTDVGEITAVVTACKFTNVRHKLFKNKEGVWRIFYYVKPAIQGKFKEVVDIYRDVKGNIA